MIFILDVAEPTIAASLRPGLVQVDVNLGVAELVVPAVAPHAPRLHLRRGYLVDQVDGEVWVDFPLGLDEPGEAVVVLVPDDAGVGFSLGDLAGLGSGCEGLGGGGGRRVGRGGRETTHAEPDGVQAAARLNFSH